MVSSAAALVHVCLFDSKVCMAHRNIRSEKQTHILLRLYVNFRRAIFPPQKKAQWVSMVWKYLDVLVEHILDVASDPDSNSPYLENRYLNDAMFVYVRTQ